VQIHVLPPNDSAPTPLGPGDFVVAGFDRKKFGDLLQRLDGVRVVQAMSAGVDDLVGHIPEGAALCDAAGVHDAPVADWTVMAILATYRRLPQFILNQNRARWTHPAGETHMNDLEGARVLIVGYGSIGHAVEARLAPFAVTVKRVARHARPGVSDTTDLPKLLPESDVVVILLPLTPDTDHFADAKFFSLMRPGSLLVNPARGRLVDTEALMNAVAQHRIRAALDVTDPEPLPDGHPLWKMGGVLITPHIAGSVAAAYDRAWRLVVEQLGRYLAGEPLRNVVAHGY
jgi:phosphoglycerate dehydrogenase-like enzyme